MGSRPGPSLPEPPAPLHTGWRRGGDGREAGQRTSNLDPRDFGRALTSWRAARLRKSQHGVTQACNTPSKFRRKASLGSRVMPSGTGEVSNRKLQIFLQRRRSISLKVPGPELGYGMPPSSKGMGKRWSACTCNRSPRQTEAGRWRPCLKTKREWFCAF